MSLPAAAGPRAVKSRRRNGPSTSSAIAPPPSPTVVPPPSTNLYVTGLSAQYTPPKTRALFARYGPIYSVVVFKNRRSACVQYHDPAHAAAAVAALNGRRLGPQTLLEIRYAAKTYVPRAPDSPPSPVASDTDSVGSVTSSPSSDAGSGTLTPRSPPPSPKPISPESSQPSDTWAHDLFPDLAVHPFPGEEAGDDAGYRPPSPRAVRRANALLADAFRSGRW